MSSRRLWRWNFIATLEYISGSMVSVVVLLLSSGIAFAREPSSSGAAATSAGKAPASSRAAESANAGVATVPPSTTVEKKAAKLSGEALGADFKAGQFTLGEEKLREAIRICVPEVCSPGFQARLHRDLGYIYVVGFLRVDDGKDEFTVALSLDPTVALTVPMQSPEVTTAFAEVKTQAGAGTASQAAPAQATPEPAAPTSTPPAEANSGDSDSGNSDDRIENWVMLSVQQDLVFHSKTPDACGLGSRYECFDALGQRKVLGSGDFAPGGNQISGSGASPGTLRILLGYERVVHPNVSLGVRVGSVLTGKARRMDTDQSFLFFHGEGRITVWLGRNVFSKAGIRPYLFASGGIAEADGKILVDYSLPNAPQTYKLDAWKRSGHSFLGPGLGLQVAIHKNNGPLAELRYMQFLSPNVPVIALQLGYAIGF